MFKRDVIRRAELRRFEKFKDLPLEKVLSHIIRRRMLILIWAWLIVQIWFKASSLDATISMGVGFIFTLLVIRNDYKRYSKWLKTQPKDKNVRT